MSKATRDITSNDDIVATCGDASCATSDAEMTADDGAMVALVASESLAPAPAAAAMTYEEAAALPEGARVVFLSSGKTYVKHNDGSRPGQFYFQAVRNGERFGRGYYFRAGRFGRAA